MRARNRRLSTWTKAATLGGGGQGQGQGQSAEGDMVERGNGAGLVGVGVGAGAGAGVGASASRSGPPAVTSYTFTAPPSNNSNTRQNSTGVKPNVGRYNSVTRDDNARGPGTYAGTVPAPFAPPIPKPPQASYNNPITPAPNPFSNANAARSITGPNGPASPRSIMTYGTTNTSSTTSSTNRPPNGGNATAIVRVTYIPSMPDELSITPGETLRIASAFDDGWALCVNGMGEQGMVPLECLEGGPGQFGGNEGGAGGGGVGGGVGGVRDRNSRRASSLAGAGRAMNGMGGQGR